MGVTTVPIGVGSAPGDGLGDPARTGGQSYNTSIANLDAAVEELQSANYEEDNTSTTVALGERIVSNSHGGITKTLPATAGSLSTTGFNDIWISNLDSNSNITVAPQAGEEIFLNGTGQGAGSSVTLLPGFWAVFTGRTGGWDMWRVPVGDIPASVMTGFDPTGQNVDDVLVSDGTDFLPVTKEAADLVERDAPAIELTPYLKHETRATRSSGTETVTCSDDPSVHLPISGNNVTIHLDVPALSLPVRGLSEVQLRGQVTVYMGSAYSGLTVTTDAGTKLAPFPKGTAPNTAGEYATLVWKWFDDGVTDFMWAEWIND